MANPIQEARDDAWETFRQVGDAVAHPPDDAGGQQVGQGAVDRSVGLAQDARQFCCVDERHLTEGME